ncbi:helix-hairpin-helix domain-containing protein, partial [Halolamina salina]
MDEYPSDQDYKAIVEEKYGRDKAQAFFRRHSHVLVHSGETEDLADLTRRMYIGYDRTNSLKEDVLEKDKRKKATAFIFESEADEEDLIQDLERNRGKGYQYNGNKDLEVQSVVNTDDGFEINLQYEDRSPSRRPLQNTQTRSITVSLTQTDEDGVWQGTQEYRYADEFNAASDFFDDWESKRLSERKPGIKRVNFNLETIPAEDSVEMFNKFLRDTPGDWRFEQVLELGIKQSGESAGVLEEEETEFEEEEEIEEELDEELRGITDAVFKGSSLRENQFVQDCLDSGFYFNS